MSDDDYLYRVDNFNALRRQRFTDPVLRGRRLIGNEQFYPHHQIRTANADLPAGDGVFRLSFWKSWDAMRRNLWARHKGVVIQRVPLSHQVLRNTFCRDDDEYLKHDAWLYWAQMPVDSSNDDWSPVGIPHSDIEALMPDGVWHPLGEAPGLGVTSVPGWTHCTCTYAERTFPVHIASVALTSGERAVLLRKPIGPWPNTFGTLVNIIQSISQSMLAASTLSADENSRWFLAQEESDCVHVEQFFPVITPPKAGLVAHLKSKICARNGAVWSVALRDETRFLSKAETEALYDTFDIRSALNYVSSWNYAALVPTYDL